MIIKAHIFETEQECINAIALIDAYCGYPNNGADTYAIPVLNNEKWFIVENEDSVAVLGEGVEFELVQPSFDDFV
jgi:hypothetical protein